MTIVFEDLANKVAGHIRQHQDVTAEQVQVERAKPIAEFEERSYNIIMGEDLPLADEGFTSYNLIDWRVLLIVELSIRTGGATQESDAFRKISESRAIVHQQVVGVMRTNEEGVGYLVRVIPRGSEGISVDREAQKLRLVQRLLFEFHIRTPANSIEVP